MNSDPTQIDFVQYHLPPLPNGRYQVLIDQTLSDTTSKINTGQGEGQFSSSSEFFVAGERFHLLPAQIQSVFPPAAGLGEYSHVLPHIMLTRNTLPWEREALPGHPNTPWLALLVIHQDETSDALVSQTTLGSLKTASNNSPFFPGISDVEPGQEDDLKISVLDVRRSLLEEILPDPSSLEFLTHIRQGKDANDQLVGEDMAILVANRLPKKGGANTVHLVSLEARYSASSNAFDYGNANSNDMVRLVQLYSWTFTPSEHFKVSETVLDENTDLDPALKTKVRLLLDQDFYQEDDFSDALTNVAGLTAQELNDHQATLFELFAFGDFSLILQHLNRATSTLRLPDTGNTTTDAYLASGFYPLPHHLRQGGQTVSWYHGPLAPSSGSGTLDLPAKGSDQLLRYYPDIGMFDVAYAAAWELGRLLSLQNTSFSTGLYQWKRRYARCVNKQDQINTQGTGHLLGSCQDNTPEPLPQDLLDWLTDLNQLQGVPFNYLVPDEELLPPESIRFFQVDQLWVEALLDGAFSVGRVTSKDHALDTQITTSEVSLSTNLITGFVLRSEVVPGWPDMLIEGYHVVPSVGSEEAPLPTTAQIPLIRRAKLGKNVLLCLFDGDLQTLDLHLKPEVLHFGVNPADGGGYEKELRDQNGLEHANDKVMVLVDQLKVLDVADLIQNIQNQFANKPNLAWVAQPTSAHLAVQLLEGVERVRFIRS